MLMTILQGAHAPYTSAPEDFAGHPIFRNSTPFTFLEVVRTLLTTPYT
jgi:hypothetical protein